MASSRAERLLRKPGRPRGISYQELFFDLVFVFALTQLSQWLLDSVTTQRHVVLAAQALLLLLTLLMLWFGGAWLTNLYDPQQPEIQLVIAAAMFGVLVMAVSLPQAFGSKGLVFACAYVAIHFSRGLVLVPSLRGNEALHRTLGVQTWFAISAVPWIIGGAIADPSKRAAFWALAVTIEYAGITWFFPAPWIRRPWSSHWPVVPEHMAERYQQFFIVVLGELIAVTGANGANYVTSLSHGAAFFMSFATTVLLWLTYLYRAGTLLPAAIAAVPAPARLVRVALLSHMIMVAGIVATDAGFELAISQPLGHMDPAWIGLIVGGPTAFLAGRVMFGHTIFNRFSKPRVIATVVLAATAPAMIFLPPLAVATTVALVLACVATSDALLARGHPPTPPSPPAHARRG